MNRFRHALPFAAALATAAFSLSDLCAQTRFGPKASCEAVFEALRSGDEKAFQATLPTAGALEGFFRARGQDQAFDRPGAAEAMRQRMVDAATRRFLRTREELGSKLDWKTARFLTEIPPTTREGRYDLAPLAFLIFDGDRVWQLGGNDVMRIGLTWSFVEGPFFHGLCDPKEAEKTRLALQAAREDEQRANEELEALRDRVRREGMEASESGERRLFEQEQKLRQEFREQLTREREELFRQMQNLDDRFRKEIQEAREAQERAEARAMKAEAMLEEAQMDLREMRDAYEEQEAQHRDQRLEMERQFSALKQRYEQRKDRLSNEEREAVLERSVTLDLVSAPAADVLIFVGNEAGLPLVLGEEFLLEADDVQIGAQKTRTARQWLKAAAGSFEPEWRDGVLYFAAPTRKRPAGWLDTLPEVFRHPIPVEIDFLDAEVLFRMFHFDFGVQVWQTESGQLALEEADVALRGTTRLPLASILDLIAGETASRWQCIDGVVLWTLKPMTAPGVMPEVEERMVSIELPAQEFADRLKGLSQACGVQIQVDPKIAEAAAEDVVSLPALHLQRVPVGTVLKLLEADIEEMTGSQHSWSTEGSTVTLR